MNTENDSTPGLDPVTHAPASDEAMADLYNLFGIEATSPSTQAPGGDADGSSSEVAREEGAGLDPSGLAPSDAQPPAPSVSQEPKQPEAPTQVPPAPAAPTLDPETAMRIKALETALEDAKAAPKGDAPAPASQPEGAKPEELAPISFQMPQNMRDAIESGDGAALISTIESIVSGVSNFAQQAAQRIATQIVEAKVAEMRVSAQPAPSEADLNNQAAAMRDSYYAKFPDHNKPIYVSVLNNTMQAMAAQFPNHPFDENFIAVLGKRVNDQIAASGLTLAGQPLSGATPPGKPPVMLAPGTRPGGASSAQPDISDEIMDILG